MPGAMPSDRARTLRERQPMSTRRKWLWAALSGAVIIAAVLAIVLNGTGRTKKGCLNVIVPSIYGGITIDQCGQAARATCAAGGVKGMYTTRKGAHDTLAVACRRAGYPVGNG